MGGVRQLPDDLHCNIPGSDQLLIFLRIYLPQGGAIECCGVYTQKVDNQFRLKVPKLLQDLVDLVKQDCSLTQYICFCFRRIRGQTQLGGEVVTKVLCCSDPGQSVSIQSYWTYLLRVPLPGEEEALGLAPSWVGVCAEQHGMGGGTVLTYA